MTMRRTRRRLLLTTALAPVLVLATACSGADDPAEAGDSRGTTASAHKERSEPLNAAELRSALLTENDARGLGYRITGGDARTGADAGPEVEKTRPAACLTLQRAGSENVSGRGETAAAWSIMYLSGGEEPTGADIFPRQTVLTSYPVKTARAHMTRLREAVAACGRFDTRNPYGTSSVTTEALEVPDLGEDAVRFRLLSTRTEVPAEDGGFVYSLLTVVRTGGVITSVRTSDVLGSMPPDKLAEFRPEPGPDEPAIAALVKKVAEAEKATPAP